jgi:DNA primase large subunit
MLKPLELGARFPFLDEARSVVKRSQVSVNDLVEGPQYLQARSRAWKRIEAALSGERYPDDSVGANDEVLLQEILSYLYAKILVSAVNDEYLIRKFTMSEAKLFEARLKRLEKEEVGHGGAMEGLSVGIRRVFQHLGVEWEDLPDGKIGIHFATYLALASLIGDKHYSLEKQDLQAGLVKIHREDAYRVLEEVYRHYLNGELPVAVSEPLYEAIQGEAERLAILVKEIRMKLEGTGGVLDEESFPPCIKRLMEMTGKSENVPHMGRFTMVAFLHTIGYDKEGLISLFSRWPDFNISKSMYQIQHIIGEISGTEYTPPMCSTMKTYGICYNPDDLCARINHPLNYYRRKLRLTGKLPSSGEPPAPVAREEKGS